MSHTMAIETTGLTNRYGSIEAVRGLDLQVPAGSICGLRGPNGAGKTTTLKMLVGLTRPSAGTDHVLGRRIDDRNESVAIRRRTGFVSEGKELFEYMTVAESDPFHERVLSSVATERREPRSRALRPVDDRAGGGALEGDARPAVSAARPGARR